jgi:hypothetical protein
MYMKMGITRRLQLSLCRVSLSRELSPPVLSPVPPIYLSLSSHLVPFALACTLSYKKPYLPYTYRCRGQEQEGVHKVRKISRNVQRRRNRLSVSSGYLSV